MIALTSAGARPAAGQESVSYGSIGGRVADETDGVLPGAQVAVTHSATNVVTTVTTDGAGRFRVPYLRPGEYTVRVTITGFAPATRSVSLSVGAAFDLPIKLTAGASETVSVTASAAVIEAARSQSAGTVSQTEVKALPLNGRNFLDLALLIPGVSATNVGGGSQLFPETSAVAGVGLSVGSQRNLSNNFMVDGLSANDDSAALSGISFSVDAIDQFQVVTSGGQAELGRALGGHVNLATRSGTNARRIDGYGFFRDDRFNGRNALTGARLPMHQNQFGGSIGGPLRRDRTFYFLNLERRTLDQSGLVTISEANASAINTRLASLGYGGPSVATGIYSNPVDTLHALGKVDHHLAGGSLLTVRYSSYSATSTNARGVGGTAAPSASAGLDNLDQTFAVNAVVPLSARTVLETRGQIARGDLQAEPADLIGPAVSISGVASFGRSSSSPTGRMSTMYQAVGSVVHHRGSHSVRGGVDFLFNDAAITFPRSVRGSYAFSSLPNFLSGIYNNSGFTQTFGDTVVAQTNPNAGLYVQDEWHASRDLTLNLGVRYDLQYLRTITTDTNNVSPRVGLAWSPFEAHQGVIRVSAGRFYDRVPLRALANALLSANNTTDLSQLRQISVSLSPTQTGAPVFPAILGAIVPTTTLINFTTMDRNLQNGYSNQFAAEFEHRLGGSGTVTVGYQHLRGRQLIMQINQNVPGCAASGSNNGCRPNPNYANNNQYSSAGSSQYNGLHLSLVQRPVSWGSLRVSYAYSRSMNNLGEAFFSSPLDHTDLSRDWGRSDDDQRHRLVVSGTVQTPSRPGGSLLDVLTSNFQISTMMQYYSALPFNITTGTNTIQGTAARPLQNGVVIDRNTGEGSPFSTVSLRVMRAFRVKSRASIEGMLEVFNLFDRRNDLARIAVFGAGTYPTNPAANFGQVTAVGDPRTIQLGFRIRY